MDTSIDDLKRIYAEVDAAFDGWTCETSTDCCRFGVTGREPYVTPVELKLIEHAVRARGGLPKRRTLPLAEERRCDLLSDEGQCLIYESRPLGCRTFFCSRAEGPKVSKQTIRDAVARISALSNGGARPLSRAIRLRPR